MKISEFEEKEYESPLYNQLERETNLIWSPGQCFEHFIGIDRSFCINDRMFHKMGFNRYYPGIFLSHYNWNYIWFLRRKKKLLPPFRLNLFIQSKRPFFGRAPKYGFKKRCYRFDILISQQKVLEKVANNLKNKALLIYAAPIFRFILQRYRRCECRVE